MNRLGLIESQIVGSRATGNRKYKYYFDRRSFAKIGKRAL